MRLLFHVGMGKTGSSSIQWFLTRNAHKLERSKICYPKGYEYLVSGAHHPISALLTEAVANGVFTPEQEERLSGLLSYFEKSGCYTLLLSSEFASRRCARAITKLFSQFEVKIIFYLRPQEDFIDSVINQQVKTYKTRITSIEVTQSHFEMASYLPLLDAWSDVVGVSNVIVRRLGASNLVGGSLFKDFYELLECEWPFDKREFILPDSNVNKSLSRESIELLVELNKYEIAKADHQKILLYMQKYSDGQSTRLVDEGKKSEIREYFKAENKKIYTKYISKSDGNLF